MKIANKDDQVTIGIRPDELDEWQAACDAKAWICTVDWHSEQLRAWVPRLIAEVRRLQEELESEHRMGVANWRLVQQDNDELRAEVERLQDQSWQFAKERDELRAEVERLREGLLKVHECCGCSIEEYLKK